MTFSIGAACTLFTVDTSVISLYNVERGFPLSSDSVVCNNEKLLSGSTSSFLMDCEQFLNSTIFQDGNGPGPTAILAPSNMGHMQDYTDVEKVTPPNFAIEVRAREGCMCMCKNGAPARSATSEHVTSLLEVVESNKHEGVRPTFASHVSHPRH